MKIAVTGVGGAGKTTLCKLISAQTGLPLMTDVMDTWLWDRGYASGKDLAEKKGVAGVMEWYLGALEEKVGLDKSRDRFIADKSVLDHGARWFARMFPEATQEQHLRVMDLLENGSKGYDQIIFLPLDLTRKVEDNAMRTTDPVHRYRIDTLLRGLASVYGINMTPYNFKFTDHPTKVIADLGLNK
ncbi:MAG: AAA family ATPase [Candidatus Pacearchaeota archaeon]